MKLPDEAAGSVCALVLAAMDVRRCGPSRLAIIFVRSFRSRPTSARALLRRPPPTQSATPAGCHWVSHRPGGSVLLTFPRRLPRVHGCSSRGSGPQPAGRFAGPPCHVIAQPRPDVDVSLLGLRSEHRRLKFRRLPASSAPFGPFRPSGPPLFVAVLLLALVSAPRHAARISLPVPKSPHARCDRVRHSLCC